MSLRNLIGNRSYRFSSRSIISCMLRNRFRSFGREKTFPRKLGQFARSHLVDTATNRENKDDNFCP